MSPTAGKSWYKAYFKRRKYQRDNIWHGLYLGPRTEKAPGVNRCRMTLAATRANKSTNTMSKRSWARFEERAMNL